MKLFRTLLACASLVAAAHAQFVPFEAARFTGTNELSSGAFNIKSGAAFTLETGSTFTINVSTNWGDGIRQTFNPSSTAAGINVGALAGNPSVPVNGDLWYNTTSGKLYAYVNGSMVEVGGSGTGSGDLLAANNLSELAASAATARANLGLTIGTHVLAPNGSGASLTGLNASALGSGTVPLARISNLTNAEIAVGAAIALSKLATDPLARGNHTGSQAQSTVTNLTTDIALTKQDCRTFVFDGAGSAIPSGLKVKIPIRPGGTISGWEITADGSITIIVRKSTPSGTSVGTLDEISSPRPAISTGTRAVNSSLGSWGSLAIADNDYIEAEATGTITATNATFLVWYSR